MRRAAATAKPASPLELNGVDIEAGRVDVFGRVLHDLKVTALRADADWRLRLSGREVEGTAVWRGPAAGRAERQGDGAPDAPRAAGARRTPSGAQRDRRRPRRRRTRGPNSTSRPTRS